MMRPSPAWSAVAISRLRDAVRCPVCERADVTNGWCPECGADFSGEVAGTLWQASQSAADALEVRQSILDAVPVRTAAARIDAGERSRMPLPAPARTPSPAASTTVQSVLAVSGAGLLAVAAAVFTFFNPDLRDAGARAAVMAGVSVVFLLGAWLLVRRHLRFSAEAVGALGVVFLVLTVVSALAALPTGLDAGFIGAVVTLVAGAGMTVLGVRVGLRGWLWSGLVALVLVPVMLAAPDGRAPAMVAGFLASAAAASALTALAGRLRARVSGSLAFERVTLTLLQAVAVLAALRSAVAADGADVPAAVLVSATLAAIAAVAVCSSRHPAGRWWSGAAGASIVAAAAVLPMSVPWPSGLGWPLAVVPVAAGTALVVVGAAGWLQRLVARTAFLAGAIAAMGAVLVIPSAVAALSLAVAALLPHASGSAFPREAAHALTLGLAYAGIALVLFGALTWGVAGLVGLWYLVLAALTLMADPDLAPWVRIALAVTFVAAVAVLHTRGPLRRTSLAVRMPLLVGAHAFVILALSRSWEYVPLALTAGAVLVLTIAALSLAMPARSRFVYVGAAFAYALVLLGTALAYLGLDAVIVLCTVTSVAGAVAVAATFAPWVPSRMWLAILAVTSVPFGLGVLQVVLERSGWTALSTSVIFVLALSLVSTTREGLGVVVRALAAGILVPAASVVFVCLGAQFLEISGSPVVLPLIALLCAVVLSALPVFRRALESRITPAHAVVAMRAIESSVLVTAVIAVALALGREAAGLGTTTIVLTILGAGFLGAAGLAGRRYGWWLAGAAFTGALWCTWGMLGVTGIEAHVLPPALAAVVVGVVHAAVGKSGRALFTAGLGTAVGVLLVSQAFTGTFVDTAIGGNGATDAAAPPGAVVLVTTAWALVLAATVVRRVGTVVAVRLRGLAVPSLWLAIVAGLAAPVQSVRWGTGLDAAPAAGVPLIVAGLAVGIVAAGAAGCAGRGIRLQTAQLPAPLARWLLAPAVALLAASAWPVMASTWLAIWTMWTLMLALLATMVVTAVVALRRGTALPPVPFMFAVAFVTAVVAWSPRELRVEWFSLPLGLFLLAAGAVGLRRPAAGGSPTLWAWPVGWRGSWRLLGPGLAVLLSASIAATYTDPRTWRAILVMAIALAAVLVGALARLAAPFVIGIVVLPVENVLAFMVQIGRGIEAMPWWITLSVVGAVLLIIAVAYERRAESGAGLAARLRDLG